MAAYRTDGSDWTAVVAVSVSSVVILIKRDWPFANHRYL